MKSSMVRDLGSFRLEDGVHIDTDWEPFAVTDQFIADAAVYHEKYFQNDYWTYLVDLALKQQPFDRSTVKRVLDIGSGSGNTVFPLANLLPNAEICSNDISPQLLKILVSLEKGIPELSGRIQAYCFDLHKDLFADEAFDLIVGGAILHHILDPKAVLTNAARWLKPGGSILLIEPMEVGGHMMAAIYLTLLDVVFEHDSPRLTDHFKSMLKDYEARFGLPAEKPWTHDIDDKWLFHPAYLKDVARDTGLTLISITPTLSLENVFTDMIKGTFGLAGISNKEVPDKAWGVLREFDQGISMELKKQFTPEGVICLRKNFSH